MFRICSALRTRLPSPTLFTVTLIERGDKYGILHNSLSKLEWSLSPRLIHPRLHWDGLSMLGASCSCGSLCGEVLHPRLTLTEKTLATEPQGNKLAAKATNKITRCVCKMYVCE